MNKQPNPAPPEGAQKPIATEGPPTLGETRIERMFYSAPPIQSGKTYAMENGICPYAAWINHPAPVVTLESSALSDKQAFIREAAIAIMSCRPYCGATEAIGDAEALYAEIVKREKEGAK